MQQNYPYPPSPQFGVPPGPPYGGDPNRAKAMVQGPAIALLVIGIVGVLAQLGSLAVNLLGAGFGAAGAAGGDDVIVHLFSGAIGLVTGGLSLIFYAVVIFGAMKMKELENYPLAMASAVLALLPCSFCCLLGTPIGIWALVVLLNEEVKTAFR